jgi:hypothetical protein
MTPAYAFTDYKSQRQTIEYIIVYIGDPPTGVCHLLVSMLRSRGVEGGNYKVIERSFVMGFGRKYCNRDMGFSD